MGYIAGIDEAGRGPVIGPLVVATVVVEGDREEELKKAGVRDSKKLSPSRREKLFEDILRLAEEVKYSVVPPEVVGDPDTNLNATELEWFIKLLNSLSVRPSVVYADAADVNAERFGRSILRGLEYSAEVIAKHRADETYPVVSAASIVAKVVRDREIENLKEVYGDFGSGYPSDLRTREFLESYFKAHGSFPPIVRRSWKTLEKIREKVGRTTLDRFLR